MQVQEASAWTENAPGRAGLATVAQLATAWASLARHLDEDEPSESLIISALKLVLVSLGGGGREGRRGGIQGMMAPEVAPTRPDGRQPLDRAVDLGATLAELSSSGVPLDAEAIAAGIVLEAVSSGALDLEAVEARLGSGVASLVHDVLRIRSAPERVELYDDVASRYLASI